MIACNGGEGEVIVGLGQFDLWPRKAGLHVTLKPLIAPLVLSFSVLCVSTAHAQYGPPPPPPGAYGQGPGGWDAPPLEFREYARRGFQDGVDGARRDVENHRRPNVNNRDEFRHPNVPGQFRHDYRQGFRRGYNVAMQHMLNGRR